MSNTKAKVLVLGGGIGGIVASTVLKKAHVDNVDITVIDKVDRHHYASSYPLLITGKRKEEDITRDLKESFRKKGINFLNREITNLDLQNKSVGMADEELTYDYLIISLGAEFQPEAIPGFRENALNIYAFEDAKKVAPLLANFKAGKIVLFVSGIPFKCPPAPYEMIFLIDEYFRKRGIRNNIKLTIVTPEPRPEPLAEPAVGKSVERMLSQRGIALKTGVKPQVLMKDVLIMEDKSKIEGDLFLGIPEHRPPKVLQNLGIGDENGWVEVDPHTLSTKFPSVYAIGDCNNLKPQGSNEYAPKAGIFAHYQGEVVARNIAQLIAGKPATYRYTAKGA